MMILYNGCSQNLGDLSDPWNEIRLTTREMLVKWGYGGFINKRLFVFVFCF